MTLGMGRTEGLLDEQTRSPYHYKRSYKYERLRSRIRTELDLRGIMGAEHLGTKRCVDPYTGMVPKLIAEIGQDIIFCPLNIAQSTIVTTFIRPGTGPRSLKSPIF